MTRLAAAALFAVLLPAAAAAQDPPDSLRADPDSLQDSTRVADSLAADSAGRESPGADTLAADSIAPAPVLPTLPDPTPAGNLTGVWEWDREALMGTRAQTVWELLADIPGLVSVRSGDYGAAATVFPVGHSGGGLRLYYDGAEHLPLEGSVADLTRIPVSGLGGVRVIRRPGGLEVHLSRYVHSSPRPMSLIEAGTGDLDTNMLRATFSYPRALRGKMTLGLERLDTGGRDTPGAVTGGWLRYSLHRGDRAGMGFEYRRMGTKRDVFTEDPGSVSRSDWTVQGRWTPVDGFLAEAWSTGASVVAGDSLESFPFTAESRGQSGVRFSVARGGLWGRATARFNDGEGVADRELAAELSAVWPQWGGVTARARRESWDQATGESFDLSAWVTPISYVALFAERGGGTRSVPYLKPLPPPEPDTLMNPGDPDTTTIDPDSVTGPASRFTDRSGTRLGIRLAWRDIEVTGAMISAAADSIWPTQLLFDRGGLVLPQPERRGLEMTGSIPLWPRGLYFLGEVQFWEAEDSAAAGLLYFPEHQYRGSFTFHRQYFPTGNFEVWVDLGARGRAEMKVPRPDPDAAGPGAAVDPASENPAGIPSVVPFYQDWYFRLQLRVLNLNIFATVENITFRRNNQDVPGRLLPITRGFYGVRWTFWN
ncbi:MAG: Plug domain-containing protein [Gemmatimonadetes bacterium]|nr:Plug domain-containing protein [Gemmatimonadota bacterium]MYA12949.1 Plug domain-containing protein [Gemmatimonadota bacterium]MYJ68854.1 Plug domain-containing protein [Gemmatimonadota bacterium]